MKTLFISAFALTFTIQSFAQKTDGTTKSLVAAEKEFAVTAMNEGIKTAFNKNSNANTIVFRPNPVSANTFYATQSDEKNLSWKPVYAKVSRSGDFGFTTGPYEFDGKQKTYGQYLSIWKAENGNWKLAIDIGTSHNKSIKKLVPQFIEPKDHVVPKIANEKAIKAGKEIILNTEKTLNATLKTYGSAAFSGFLDADARLLFPGNEPIIGKDKILAFYNGMVDKMNLKPTLADKAMGGDLAYTYGVATIDYKADLRESFNYVFIYEKKADFNWYIIAQVFVPAER